MLEKWEMPEYVLEAFRTRYQHLQDPEGEVATRAFAAILATCDEAMNNPTFLCSLEHHLARETIHMLESLHAAGLLLPPGEGVEGYWDGDQLLISEGCECVETKRDHPVYGPESEARCGDCQLWLNDKQALSAGFGTCGKYLITARPVEDS